MKHRPSFSLIALAAIMLCAPFARAATDSAVNEGAFDCRCDLDDTTVDTGSGANVSHEAKKSPIRDGQAQHWHILQRVLDLNKDGKLSSNTWLSMTNQITRQCANLRQKFDADNDGKLSGTEVTAMQSAAAESFDKNDETKTGLSKAEHQNMISSAAGVCNLMMPGHEQSQLRTEGLDKQAQSDAINKEVENLKATANVQDKSFFASDAKGDAKKSEGTRSAALAKILQESDGDKNGEYSAEERQILSQKLAAAQLDRMDSILEMFDVDADKLLGDGERASADGAIKQAFDKNIDRLLKKFDTDHDGKLSDSERNAAKLPALKCICMMEKQDGSGQSDSRAAK
jgi:hypothetical protein